MAVQFKLTKSYVQPVLSKADYLARRYKGAYGRTRYRPHELLTAYFQWANLDPLNRDDEWDHYCDVRDGVKPGTNAEIRRRRTMGETQ